MKKLIATSFILPSPQVRWRAVIRWQAQDRMYRKAEEPFRMQRVNALDSGIR